VRGPGLERGKRHFMQNNTNKPVQEVYSETEVAEILGVSIPRLHALLDEHIFNNGIPRPPELTFNSSDITLLSFWYQSTANPKVVRMPRRN
jgi:hypothetical protein